MSAIPHSKPWIDEEDVSAVAAVLRGGMLAQGERTEAFEQAMCAWHGLPEGRAVAVGSGAGALFLALAALDVGPGDEVVLPSYVCHSVLEAVRTAGARPVVCDVGEGWLVTPEAVAPHVSPRTRALVIPHLYGIFADIAAFRRFGLPIVEDCAQALGRCRTSLEGDVAVFSFHPTKCLTTGEGGMAVAVRSDLASTLRTLRDGSPAADGRRHLSPLSDVSGALGLAQLARYERALERRRVLWGRYRNRLEPHLPWICARYPVSRSMFFRFVFRARGGIGAYRGAFLARGVHVRAGVDRLNHRLLGLPDRDFPVSAALLETTISLPCYPAMTDDEHERCVLAALEVLGDAVAP